MAVQYAFLLVLQKLCCSTIYSREVASKTNDVIFKFLNDVIIRTTSATLFQFMVVRDRPMENFLSADLK